MARIDVRLAGNAEIAQLVEHDLAKVGVAGSSPVFRSWSARMVESVDTKDLKSFGLTAVRVQVPLRVQSLTDNGQGFFAFVW